MTKTDLLDIAFEVPGRDFDVETLPEGERSAITGAPLEGDPPEGVLSDSLLTSASSAPHEIFPYAKSNYVSEAGARCYKYFRGGLTGNLLAISDPPRGWKPMVSTKSAEKKGRPNWQRVIYGTDQHATLEEGDRCMAVFTEEFQRRLWLDARVSVVGPAWRPYLYSGGTVRTLRVSWKRLREVLALCEYVYSLGFTKDNLQSTLYGSTKKGLCMKLGLPRVQALDDALAEWRGTDELLLASFVCQRAKDLAQNDDPHSTDALESTPSYRCLIPQKKSPTNSTKTTRTSSEKPTPPTKAPSPETGQADLFPS